MKDTQDTHTLPPDSKRFRIQKLCDNCRLKKIKCDGTTPCKNCINYKLNCTYNHVPKKRQMKLRLGSGRSVAEKQVSSIETRVANVEKALEKILALVSDNKTGRVQVLNPEPMTEPVPAIQPEPVIQDTHTEVAEEEHHASVLVDLHESEHFFAAHSSFSVFSPRGIKWILTKLNNSEIVKYFWHFHLTFQDKSWASDSKWSSPIDTKDLSPLPSFDVFKLFIQLGFATLIHANVNLTEDDLITIYKKGETDKLKYSESLLLNVVCCLGVPLVTDFCRLFPEFKAACDLLCVNQTFLRELEELCYSNCIYYYHRVSVIGEGSLTITALLLLLTYTELSFNSHAQYMVVSTLTRLAQEAGLHRYESYVGLNSPEAKKRLELFLQCYIVDKSVSLRTGKPPILHDDDISAISSARLRDFWETKLGSENFYDFDAKGYFGQCSKPLKVRTDEELRTLRQAFKDKLTELIRSTRFLYVVPYVRYYYFELLELSSKAYNLLFSATLLIGKSLYDVEKIVSELNKDLYAWYETIPEPLKDDWAGWDGLGAKRSTMFKENDIDILICQSLFIPLHYHYVLMTVNRMSSKATWSSNTNLNATEKASSSIDLCLESARTLMRLSAMIHVRVDEFFKYCTFFPFCAFITLFCSCIQDITLPHVKGDIKLMIEVSMLFSSCANTNSRSKLNEIDYLEKFLCVLVIRLYDKTFPNDRVFHTLEFDNHFKQIISDMASYANVRRKRHQGTEHDTNMMPDLHTVPQQPRMAHHSVLNHSTLQSPTIQPPPPQHFVPNKISSILNGDMNCSNTSPTSASTVGSFFDDLIDQNPNADIYSSNLNYLFQNLFHLPNFLLEEDSTGAGTADGMGLFDF